MAGNDTKNYPDKLFYKIQEVSDVTDIKPYVLRYWESEFPDLAPEKDSRDQRRYRKVDIELIFTIKKLLYEERYTIAGARQKLHEERKRPRKKETGKKSGSAEQSGNKEQKRVFKKASQELRSIKTDLKSLVSYLGKK